jgi:glycoprotease/Kae1 family metallohydrolase
MVTCLGIESTAHTFGIGIVSHKRKKGAKGSGPEQYETKVLANVWDMYKPPEGWGIKPLEAAKHHREFAPDILQKALSQADLSLKDIDIVSFSQGPGLPPCLKEGLEFARSISRKIKPVPKIKPSASTPSHTASRRLIGVNHCIAHVEIGKICTGIKDPVTLYVSGANTQVLAFAEGRYRCFGETMDVGIGNALDKFGRAVGMEFPAGPTIEGLALRGAYVELPYVVKGMDLSFSGIITDAITKFRNKERLENLCYSLQETMFAMLTEVTERALAHTGKKELLLTGGVAANSRLQQMLGIMCRERGASFYPVPKEFAGDCGANIAWTGILAYRHRPRARKKAGHVKRMEILPRQRTDEVDVRWI